MSRKLRVVFIPIAIVSALTGLALPLERGTSSGNDRRANFDQSPPSTRIEVSLPKDRTKQGSLRLVDIVSHAVLFGPVPVLGKGKGPSLTKNGHTPTGTYRITSLARTGPSGPASPAGGAPILRYPTSSYGSYAVIVLDPVSGDALAAKLNGRNGLLIHAGGVETGGKLQGTLGCLRLGNINQQGLVDALIGAATGSGLSAELVVVETGPEGAESTDAPTVGLSDPPPSAVGLASMVPIRTAMGDNLRNSHEIPTQPPSYSRLIASVTSARSSKSMR